MKDKPIKPKKIKRITGGCGNILDRDRQDFVYCYKFGIMANTRKDCLERCGYKRP